MLLQKQSVTWESVPTLEPRALIWNGGQDTIRFHVRFTFVIVNPLDAIEFHLLYYSLEVSWVGPNLARPIFFCFLIAKILGENIKQQAKIRHEKIL